MESGSQLSGDIVYGAQAIAAELGIPRSTVYQLAKDGDWPIFRVRSKLAARRSELREAMSAKARVA